MIIMSTITFQGLVCDDGADYYCIAINTGANNITFQVRSQEVQVYVQRKFSLLIVMLNIHSCMIILMVKC